MQRLAVTSRVFFSRARTRVGVQRRLISMKSDLVAVYVTVPDLDTGKKLGRLLVTEKLAGCVNIIPGLTSIYTWEGKVEEDSELLLMIKTRAALVGDLTAAVISNHPYDVPEVISLPITDGHKAYMDFISESTINKV